MDFGRQVLAVKATGAFPCCIVAAQGFKHRKAHQARTIAVLPTRRWPLCHLLAHDGGKPQAKQAALFGIQAGAGFGFGQATECLSRSGKAERRQISQAIAAA